MAKKKEIVSAPETVAPKAQIQPLSAQFGQEDLNKLVEKLNEVIAHLNSVL